MGLPLPIARMPRPFLRPVASRGRPRSARNQPSSTGSRTASRASALAAPPGAPRPESRWRGAGRTPRRKPPPSVLDRPERRDDVARPGPEKRVRQGELSGPANRLGQPRRGDAGFTPGEGYRLAAHRHSQDLADLEPPVDASRRTRRKGCAGLEPPLPWRAARVGTGC